MSRISSFKFLGNDGRPIFRDSRRQNIRNAVRCHLTNVSGLTITSASRQSKKRASEIIARRVTLVILRGSTSRSLNNASCLRRNRFSAIRAARGNRNRQKKVSNLVVYKRLYKLFPTWQIEFLRTTGSPAFWHWQMTGVRSTSTLIRKNRENPFLTAPYWSRT
jgi:hypothetical protein